MHYLINNGQHKYNNIKFIKIFFFNIIYLNVIYIIIIFYEDSKYEISTLTSQSCKFGIYDTIKLL